MSVISISAWKGLKAEQKKKWIEECTSIVSDVLNEPLDEIVVFINEINKSDWGQAGIVGSDEQWLEKSIRIKEGD